MTNCERQLTAIQTTNKTENFLPVHDEEKSMKADEVQNMQSSEPEKLVNTEAWVKSYSEAGSTESERYLVNLARKAFLSLWSYSNVYTDEGRKDRGDGKELCDLLVVFGNDVILFSDKHCEFIHHADVNVAWNRWYKRAIEKSAKQLGGAESWLTRFPDRLFLDPGCKTRLPITLPEPSKRRIHLVAVTRGVSESAAAYWGGGSSGSLFIDTSLVQSEHSRAPFRVGWVLPNKRFVHVLDETTLDIVLQELDTVSDFVTYLSKKQERLAESGAEFCIPGEEELVALYLSQFDPKSQEHYFPEAPNDALVVLKEGCWTSLVASKSYRARRKENEISYLWDELIEYQNKHIISGSASVLYGEESIEIYERVMRMMAQENRLARRILGESISRARGVNKKGKRFTRTVVGGPDKKRAYVFMSLPHPAEISYSQYRELRQDQLLGYCYGCKLKFDHVREVVGIAFEPGKAKTISVDFLLTDFGDTPIDPDFSQEIRERLAEENMWNSKKMALSMVRASPFPVKRSKLFRSR